MILSRYMGARRERFTSGARLMVSGTVIGLALAGCSGTPAVVSTTQTPGSTQSPAAEPSHSAGDSTSAASEGRTTPSHMSATEPTAEESTPVSQPPMESEALGKKATDTSGGDGRKPAPVADPVDQSEEVQSGGLEVALGAVESVELDDSIPGEVAGESSAVSIQLQNDSQQPISLELAFAQAEKGEQGDPAVERDGRRSGDFSEPLKPGESRTLTFVFAGSPEELTRVFFGYDPAQELVQFEVR